MDINLEDSRLIKAVAEELFDKPEMFDSAKRGRVFLKLLSSGLYSSTKLIDVFENYIMTSLYNSHLYRVFEDDHFGLIDMATFFYEKEIPIQYKIELESVLDAMYE